MMFASTAGTATAREKAKRALDGLWPAGRGETVAQSEAYRVAQQMSDGAISEYDHASLSALLANLISGGLLVYAPCERRGEHAYARPLVDVVPTASPTVLPPVMFTPAGGEARPYVDVLAEQRARQEQQKMTINAGVTFDE